MTRRSFRAILLSASCLWIPAVAFAADYVVSTDTGTTNGGNVLASNDSLTVSSGVTIDAGVAGTATEVLNGANFVEITNNGTITFGDNGFGLNSAGLFTVFSNNGTITSGGANAVGLNFARAGGEVYNSGTIYVDGAGATAINFETATTYVYSSGRIISVSGTAINFNDAENGLYLDVGAYVEGAMILGGSTFVEIATGAANAFQFEFSGTDWFSIDVHGDSIYVIDTINQTVASIDPTQFDALRTAAGALAGNVFGLSSARSSDLLMGGNITVSTKYGPALVDPIVESRRETPVWVAGLLDGTWRAQNGNNLAYVNTHAGAIGGIDLSRGRDGLFGVVGGIATGRYGANGLFMRSHRIQTNAGLLGIHGARWVGNSVFDYALIGGRQQHNSQRSINNNAAPGGIDTGIATYGSWFLSPQASLSRQRDLGDGLRLTTTGAVSYTLGLVDGYTETASLSVATFNARRYGVLSGAANATISKDLGRTTLSETLGVFAQAGSDTLSGTLLGIGWAYSDASLSGFGASVGLGVDHRFSDNVIASLNAAVDAGGTAGMTVKGSASLRIQF